MLPETSERSRILTGVAIIVLGVLLFLSTTLDVRLNEWVWIILLAGAAAAFAWVYSREREPWALIATYVFGVIAVLVFLVTQINLTGVTLPVAILLAIAAPFVIAWWLKREEWGLLVPAYVLTAIALGLLLIESNILVEMLVPAYVMFAIGVPFFVGYVVSREWSLLIPGGILCGIGLVFLLSSESSLSGVLGLVVPVILIAAGLLVLFNRSESGIKAKHG